LKDGWKKDKYLKNTDVNNKTGRKLNLADRIANDKP